MLYVFTGTDTAATRAAAHEFLDAYERRGTRPVRIPAEECTPEVLADRAGVQSLFSAEGDAAAEMTVIDTPSERGALDGVVAHAALLADSANIFVLVEGKLLAAHAKPLRKHAAEYTEVAGSAPGERFNTFALADALARRDRKSLWVLLMRARSAGVSAEEIIGVLFWQVKTMRLATGAANAAEAGLKPFVYDKARRGASKFSADELADASATLVSVYHDARLGLCDIDLALERWVLEV